MAESSGGAEDFKCFDCHYQQATDFHYCPNCGVPRQDVTLSQPVYPTCGGCGWVLFSWEEMQHHPQCPGYHQQRPMRFLSQSISSSTEPGQYAFPPSRFWPWSNSGPRPGVLALPPSSIEGDGHATLKTPPSPEQQQQYSALVQCQTVGDDSSETLATGDGNKDTTSTTYDKEAKKDTQPIAKCPDTAQSVPPAGASRNLPLRDKSVKGAGENPRRDTKTSSFADITKKVK